MESNRTFPGRSGNSTEAAEGGHAESQFLLGTIYVKGNGVLTNLKTARSWFEKAEKNGHPDAKAALEKLDEMEGKGRATPEKTDTGNHYPS